jgi:hypothetical protein
MIDKIQKLPKDNRILLRDTITSIRLRDKNLKIKKITKSDFYQVNNKVFKILLHYDTLGNVIIDSIRSKNPQ